jgi:hypothetical protein
MMLFCWGSGGGGGFGSKGWLDTSGLVCLWLGTQWPRTGQGGVAMSRDNSEKAVLRGHLDQLWVDVNKWVVDGTIDGTLCLCHLCIAHEEAVLML